MVSEVTLFYSHVLSRATVRSNREGSALPRCCRCMKEERQPSSKPAFCCSGLNDSGCNWIGSPLAAAVSLRWERYPRGPNEA